MSEHAGEPKALERVTSEMRDAPAPEPDWERVEQQLFARIDADERATRRAGTFRIVAVLAAAAALLLVVGGVMRSGPGEVARAPAVSAPAARVFGPGAERVDGAGLAVGDRVVAGAAQLAVEHAGRGTWTLDPSSQATLTATGKVISLRLTEGAVSAQVVPSDEPETFVIEVERVRVAVHGTAFRVVRAAQGVEVSVTEGVVAVGAQGERPTFFLRANDAGKFSSDGTRGEVQRPTQAAAELQPHAATKPGTSAKPALAAAPSSADVGKALDQLSSATTSCFEAGSAKGEVRVQIQTRLDASFGADGRVRSLVFDPPLAPALTECVRREAQKVRVPESASGGSGQRDVLLGT